MSGAWFEAIFDERYPELFGPLEGNAEKEVEEILALVITSYSIHYTKLYDWA